MLGWLFRRNEDSDTQQQREEGRALLKRICQNHTFIEVALDDGDTSYRSLILSVEKNSILIDELFPLDGGARLRTGQTLEIFCSEGGYNISFTAQLLSEEKNEGIPVYRLSLPDYVEHHQRRAAFRVSVPAASRITIVLSGYGGSAVSGVIVDLSSSGARIHVGGTREQGLEAGTLVSDARFTIDDERFKCQLRVSNSHFARRPYAHLVLGCELSGLDGASQVKLDRYIATLQREQRRTRLFKEQDVD